MGALQAIGLITHQMEGGSMLKIIVIAVLLLVAGLLIYAASKPDSFRIERSTTIKAPPGKVFALINDFHQWESW